MAGIADRRAADLDVSRQHERLEPRTRQTGNMARQHAVEPLAGFLGGDDHDVVIGVQDGLGR